MASDQADDDDLDLSATPKSARQPSEIDEAEAEITQNLRDVRYIVREYPVEVVVQKYLKGRKKEENEIYVPDYQRELVWSDKRQSRFIESLLIGLPIPYLFVADVSNEDEPEKAGRLEIVDGVQRVRTLARFLTNDLALEELDRLVKLNSFRFCDLHPSRQRRFRRVTLRLIELTEGITEDVRREIFDRINTGAVGLEAVEVRRGMASGPFLDLVTNLAHDPLLHQLAPISEKMKLRFEYEEFVTRFFAFLNRYQGYGTGEEGKVVKDFLLSYVRDTNDQLAADPQLRAGMEVEWKRMLGFVRDHFPEGGFQKRGRGRRVPRVRFEAISVGVGLALRANVDLQPKDVRGWLDSPEFKELTTSDASNNRASLIGRVEFVRDRLLDV